MTGTPRLRYTRDEILTDPDYTRRIERAGVLLHGGYGPDGTYLPPRSTHRIPAIAAWTAKLAAAGHPTRVIDPDAVDRWTRGAAISTASAPRTDLLDSRT